MKFAEIVVLAVILPICAFYTLMSLIPPLHHYPDELAAVLGVSGLWLAVKRYRG